MTVEQLYEILQKLIVDNKERMPVVLNKGTGIRPLSDSDIRIKAEKNIGIDYLEINV